MKKAFIKAAVHMAMPSTYMHGRIDGACLALSQVGAFSLCADTLKKIFAPKSRKGYWLGPPQRRYPEELTARKRQADEAMRQKRVYALLIAGEVWEDFQ